MAEVDTVDPCFFQSIVVGVFEEEYIALRHVITQPVVNGFFLEKITLVDRQGTGLAFLALRTAALVDVRPIQQAA